jgi:molecular chaperone HscB
MICWSCERAANNAGADGLTCASCGALLPPDAKASYFSVFGVEPRHDVDLEALEARYRELSRKLHPDRFAKADPRARRASLQRSVQLNQAWRALKDPFQRAEYLLLLSGISLGKEVPPALLMETLELREELGDARAAGDDAKIQAMARAMRTRVQTAMQAVTEGLAAGRLDEVARELVALRYYRRFMDEVALHDDARAESAPVPPSAQASSQMSTAASTSGGS